MSLTDTFIQVSERGLMPTFSSGGHPRLCKNGSISARFRTVKKMRNWPKNTCNKSTNPRSRWKPTRPISNTMKCPPISTTYPRENLKYSCCCYEPGTHGLDLGEDRAVSLLPTGRSAGWAGYSRAWMRLGLPLPLDGQAFPNSASVRFQFHSQREYIMKAASGAGWATSRW